MRIKDDFMHLLQSLLGFLKTRASLFGVEFAQERQRFVGMAILAILAVFFLFFAFLMLNVGILVYFWETEYRLWSVFGLAVCYILLSFVCVINTKRQFKGETFPHTKAVLKEDLAQFRMTHSTNTSLVVVDKGGENG